MMKGEQPGLDIILAATAKHYGLTAKKMQGRMSGASRDIARHAFMYCAHQLGHGSMLAAPVIGLSVPLYNHGLGLAQRTFRAGKRPSAKTEHVEFHAACTAIIQVARGEKPLEDSSDSDNDGLVDQIAELQAKLDDAEKRTTEANDKLADAKKRASEAEEKATKAEASVKTAEKALDDERKQRKAVKEARNAAIKRAEEAESTRDEQKARADRAKEALDASNDRAATAEQKLKQAKASINELESKLVEAQATQADTKELDALREQLKAANSANQELTGNLKAAQAETQEAAFENQSLLEEISKLKTKLESILTEPKHCSAKGSTGTERSKPATKAKRKPKRRNVDEQMFTARRTRFTQQHRIKGKAAFSSLYFPVAVAATIIAAVCKVYALNEDELKRWSAKERASFPPQTEEALIVCVQLLLLCDSGERTQPELAKTISKTASWFSKTRYDYGMDLKPKLAEVLEELAGRS